MRSEASCLLLFPKETGILLIRVSVGMCLVPGPRGADDIFELGILRFPAEFANRLLRRGHQLWGVTRPARFFDGRYARAADLFAHLDHLPHRIAVAVAKVVKALLAGLQSQDMRL